jgi:2'-hydroxyisoflavone reductase
VLQTAASVANARPHIEWASEDFLERHEVGEWMQLPLWISQKSGLPGMRNVNVGRALAAGLQIRPLRETVRDTLAWAKTRPTDYHMGAGLEPAREAALLEALTG